MVSPILLNKSSTNLYANADTAKLTKELDGFPLALATAGAYR